MPYPENHERNPMSLNSYSSYSYSHPFHERGAGLNNEGNTCYLNSVLQALARSPTLPKLSKVWGMPLKICDNDEQVIAYVRKDASPIWHHLQSLFSQIPNERCSLSTGAFRREFHRHSFLESGRMHDVAEFFLNLLTIIQQEEGKRFFRKSKSPNGAKLSKVDREELINACNPLLTASLGHVLIIQRCHRCGQHKKSVDKFHILTLPIPRPQQHHNGFPQQQRPHFDSHSSKWGRTFLQKTQKFLSTKKNWIHSKQQHNQKDFLHNVQSRGKVNKAPFFQFKNPRLKTQWKPFNNHSTYVKNGGGLYGGCLSGTSSSQGPVGDSISSASSTSSGYHSSAEGTAMSVDDGVVPPTFIGPLLPSSSRADSSHSTLSSQKQFTVQNPNKSQFLISTNVKSTESTMSKKTFKHESDSSNDHHSDILYRSWPFNYWKCPKFRTAILGILFHQNANNRLLGGASVASGSSSVPSNGSGNPPPKPKYSVRDLLEHYSEPQKIDGLVECEGCGEGLRTPKTSRSFVVHAPLMLVVQVARFSWNPHCRNMTKDNRHITLTEHLMVPICHPTNTNKEEKYELFAVVCHLGDHTHSGHYKSYVRQLKDPKRVTWLCCDDESVTPVSWNEVAASQAYLLFYWRQ